MKRRPRRLLPLRAFIYSGTCEPTAVPAERIATDAVAPGVAMEPPMLDIITPILALMPYVVILAALGWIPAETVNSD
jgi:hypothetical protein